MWGFLPPYGLNEGLNVQTLPMMAVIFMMD